VLRDSVGTDGDSVISVNSHVLSYIFAPLGSISLISKFYRITIQDKNRVNLKLIPFKHFCTVHKFYDNLFSWDTAFSKRLITVSHEVESL